MNSPRSPIRRLLAGALIAAVTLPGAAVAATAAAPTTTPLSAPAAGDPADANMAANTLKRLLADAGKLAGKGNPVTVEHLQAAVADYGRNSTWERDVDFRVDAGHSMAFGAFSFAIAPDGRFGLATRDGSGGCTMAVWDNGKVTTFSFGDIGKNCTGAMALGGPHQPTPPFLDPIPPAAPTGLMADAGDSAVTLTWRVPADTDLARLEILVDGAVVVSVPAGTTTHVVAGLTNYTAYRFTVRAVDATDNVSAVSDGVTATPIDLTPPPVPADLAAAAGDSQVTATWAASDADDLQGYRVYLDGTLHATVPAGTTELVVTGLVNYTSYTVQVSAFDVHANESVRTPAVSVTPVDLTPPGVPADLAATAGDSRVELGWETVTDADLDHYVVYVDGEKVTTVPAGTTTFTADGLTNYREYTFTVSAVDVHDNESEQSAGVTAIPVDLTPPATPDGLAAEAGDGHVTLTWDAVGDADLAQYEVLQDGQLVAAVPAGATTVTVTGLTNGREYTFTVRAVDGAGNASAPSNPVTAAPVASVTSAFPVGAGVAGTPARGVDVDRKGVEQSGFAATRDGRFVAFGTASNLEPTDRNAGYELYLFDRDGGSYTRVAPLPVSQAPTSTNTTTTNTNPVALSEDGRYLSVVTTEALVPEDTNGTRMDAYRKDLRTGQWQLISVPASGKTGTLEGASTVNVALSADGRYVFFTSARTDLMAGDTNGMADLFRKDMATGAVVRVSGEAFHQSFAPWARNVTVTPDGRFVLYSGQRASGAGAMWRKDLVTGELVEVGDHKIFFEYERGRVDISDDGRYVAFLSGDHVLPASNYGTMRYAYRKDMVTGEYRHMGNGTRGTFRVTLDPTGRYGYFSDVHGLVPADTNDSVDWYRRDFETGNLDIVTTDAAGAPAANWFVMPHYYWGQLVPLAADRVMVLSRHPLVPFDGNGRPDLFDINLATGDRASVAPGEPASGGPNGDSVLFSNNPPSAMNGLAMTPDGRYVAFTTQAANFVDGDYNGAWDVYRWDRLTGEVKPASVTVDGRFPKTAMNYINTVGMESGHGVGGIDISDDGRYISFTSSHNGLLQPQSAPNWAGARIIRKDMQTGELLAVGGYNAALNTAKVSAGEAGVVTAMSMSPDGRYVAFNHTNKFSVPGDTNTVADVFLGDFTDLGNVVRVSTSTTGAQANGASGQNQVAVTNDKVVTFQSAATNLVATDSNGTGLDIYRKDVATGLTTRVNTTADGTQSAAIGYGMSTTADGRFVLFASTGRYASNDANNFQDLYRKDTLTGEVKLVSVRADGTQFSVTDYAGFQALSPDGTYAAFGTGVNVIPGDKGNSDVYRVNLLTGEFVLMSKNDAGEQGNNWSRSSVAVSNDGQVAFSTDATNLRADDVLGFRDLIVR